MPAPNRVESAMGHIERPSAFDILLHIIKITSRIVYRYVRVAGEEPE